MSFDWNQYIVLAEDLNSGTPNDSQMRSAVSRAYYSAFIQCRNKSNNALNKTPKVHQLVIDHFKTSDIPEEASIGNNLDTLRIQRNNCDYDGHHIVTKQSCERLITIAKSTIQLLNQI